MSYTHIQFAPSNPIFEINGMEIEFSLLNLKALIRLEESYGTIPEIYKMLEVNGKILFDIVWILVKEKSIFSYRKSEFEEQLLTDSPSKLSEKLICLFNEIVKKSMPENINKKRMAEISKLKGKDQSTTPCYGKYFDVIAKRYRKSIDEFLGLTLRQLSIILEIIPEEEYQELEIKAALAGKKLKPRIQYNKVSDEEDKANEKEAMSFLEKQRKEYNEKVKNNGK